MKHIHILSLLLLLSLCSIGQQLSIGTGAQVVLYGGNGLQFNGLTLSSTGPLTLTTMNIEQSTTVQHTLLDPYVSRVYHFSPATPAFTGNIRFTYADGELNGLTESSLQLLAHNGSSWQFTGTSTVDASLNVVDATGIAGVTISELTLASSLALPLRWGAVSAIRRDDDVRIQWSTAQEQGVSHFDVERSQDGQIWIAAIKDIPARNLSATQWYDQYDHPTYTGILYYRIRQTDVNGRFTLSRTVKVDASGQPGNILVQPNPAGSYFTVTGLAGVPVEQVELYSVDGVLYKRWNTNQLVYTLPSLTSGIYLVRIRLTNGTFANRQLLIK